MKPTTDELVKAYKSSGGLRQDFMSKRLQGRLDVLEDWNTYSTNSRELRYYLKKEIAKIKEVLK